MNFPQYFSPSENDFLLDYPANEVARNPKLLEPAVPYDFN
jgi:hypothetical protein